MHKQKRGCFHEKITKNGFCQKILSVKTENFLLFFDLYFILIITGKICIVN